MGMKGLIFDIEDVFFDGTFFHRYLHQLICRLGKAEQFRHIQAIWQNKFLPEVYQGKLQYWDALASFFSSMGLEKSQVQELIVSAQTQLKRAQANLRLFPGVNDSLNALHKQGVRLAIVCNSIHDPEKMIDMLRRIHLRTQFDFVLTSCAAKRVMPDGPAFEAVLQAMRFQPEDLGYISTKPERLQLAQLVGLRTIQLVKPTACSGTPWSQATYSISNLSDLPQLPHALQSSRMAV